MLKALHDAMLNFNFWTLFIFLENPDEDLHDLHLQHMNVLHFSRIPADFAAEFIGLAANLFRPRF